MLLTTPATRFRLPDPLAAWPWPRRVNPHHVEVGEASAAWLESFHPFSSEAQRAFTLCNVHLLAAIGYPFATKEQLRAGCDYLNTIFVFDEYTDVEDEKATQKMADMFMDAMRNPSVPRPAGESALGEITRQFWEHASQVMCLSAQKRFIAANDLYSQSVVQQAAERDAHHIRDVDRYFENRRENIALRPTMTILLFDMDIPEEAMAHPTIVDLTTCAIDLVILTNDMYSYNMEQAVGIDGHNIITVVMHQFGVNVQEAMDWAAERCSRTVQRFLELYAQKLPSWGPEVDAQVSRYIEGIGNWIRANESWSFETHRYFGADGLKIQETRWVTLIPRKEAPLSSESQDNRKRQGCDIKQAR